MANETRREKAIRKTTKGKNANYRKTKDGAGMTPQGIAAHRKANPKSKLQGAVTGKSRRVVRLQSGVSLTVLEALDR